MAEHALPDMKSKVRIDSTSLDGLERKASLVHGRVAKIGSAGTTAGNKVHSGAEHAKRGLIDLERTAEIAKVRLGEVGAKGGELRSAFSPLSGGSMLGGLGLSAAVGGVAVVMEKATEQAEKHEKAEKLLSQAFDSQGKKLGDYKGKIEDWLQTNEQVIPDVNAARESLAGFIRSGMDYPTAIDAMNVSLNLAAIKHEDLATSSKSVRLGMMGNGRALKDLGIDLATLTHSDHNAIMANNKLTAANKAVTAATKAHDSAAAALTAVEASLAGKHKLTASEALKLKSAHDKVTKTAQDLATAQDGVKTAQSGVNNASTTGALVLDALKGKTEGGTGAYTDLEKSQHKANAEWDRAANELGPPLIQVQTTLISTATDAYAAMEKFGKNDSWWKGLNDGLITDLKAARDLEEKLLGIGNLAGGIKSAWDWATAHHGEAPGGGGGRGGGRASVPVSVPDVGGSSLPAAVGDNSSRGGQTSSAAHASEPSAVVDALHTSNQHLAYQSSLLYAMSGRVTAPPASSAARRTG